MGKSFVLLLGSANLVTLRNWGLMVSRTLAEPLSTARDVTCSHTSFGFLFFNLYRVSMSTLTAKCTSASGQQLCLRSRLRASDKEGSEGERGLRLVCECDSELPWEGSWESIPPWTMTLTGKAKFTFPSEMKMKQKFRWA